MTGVKNDLGVMDGTDFNTGAGWGLRHGEEPEREKGGRGERKKGKNKVG